MTVSADQTDDPYRAPASAVAEPEADTDGGSLESALAGDFDFRIGAVCGRAWELVRGAKLPVFGAMLISYALQFGVQGLAELAGFQSLTQDPATALLRGMALGLVSLVVTYPLTVGMLMFGVRRAAGQNPDFAEFFRYYPRLLILTALTLINAILVYLGFLLLILPGIYLGVALLFAAPLLVDRNLGVVQALLTSVKIINHRWFAFFGLFLLVGLVVALSVLPLGIGLIWSLPWALLVYGVLYHQVVGVASSG